jgi:hypothetical protein
MRICKVAGMIPCAVVTYQHCTRPESQRWHVRRPAQASPSLYAASIGYTRAQASTKQRLVTLLMMAVQVPRDVRVALSSEHRSRE